MAAIAIQGSVEKSENKGLRIGLWVAQALLAAAFTTTGLTKLTTPLEQLKQAMPWVGGAMGGLAPFIGAAELLGAIGLVLPAATRIKPALTPLAALGLATIMLLAALTHGSRGEFGMLPVNLTLGSLAAFVAWGRARKAPIAPRA